MSNETIMQTRRLPKHYKTLRYAIADWCVARGGMAESSTVAFVRHHYTNYEALLDEHAQVNCDPESTEIEIFKAYTQSLIVYERIKQEASAVALTVLNEAYGDKWNPSPPASKRTPAQAGKIGY